MAAPAGTNAVNGNRTIRPGYHLRIIVIVDDKTEVAMNDERVSESGEVLLPLLKQVHLAGMKMHEATEHLTQAYAKYFKEPHVYLEYLPMAEAEAVASGQASLGGFVSVTGRVKTPGLVPVPSTLDLTVSQAILKAGGLNSSAKDRAIRVTRRRADGSVSRETIDLRAIMMEGDLGADRVLQGGDMIYVPESLF